MSKLPLAKQFPSALGVGKLERSQPRRAARGTSYCTVRRIPLANESGFFTLDTVAYGHLPIHTFSGALSGLALLKV